MTSAGPNVVVFLHGFPEIWYSWRHQMVAVAAAGFRAIAPDYRGYGLSDPPAEPEKTSFEDITNDLLATLDHLGINKVISIEFNCFLMINLPKCFCSTSGCIISFHFYKLNGWDLDVP